MNIQGEFQSVHIQKLVQRFKKSLYKQNIENNNYEMNLRVMILQTMGYD